MPIGVVQVAAAGASAVPFTELERRGQFTPPLTVDPSFFWAIVARRIERNGTVPQALDEKFEFHHADGAIMASANWDAMEKIRSDVLLRIYDLDNRLLTATATAKLKLSKGEKGATVWTLPIANVLPGTYRLDLMRDDRCVWRTFFRIAN